MADLPIVRTIQSVFPRGEYAGNGAVIAKAKELGLLLYAWQPAIVAYDSGTGGGIASRWIYTPQGIVIYHRSGIAIDPDTLQTYLLAFS